MGCFSSKPTSDGAYEPSAFASLLVPKKSLYKPAKSSEHALSSPAKILVVATDDGRLAMQNGKVFNSGTHVSELFVPLLHFKEAGFDFDFATVSGKPVVLEMWGWPKKDEAVAGLFQQLKPKLDKPKKLVDVAASAYAGIFIPGGHGAMVNLPTSEALGKLLRDAHEAGQPTVTLCHGPAGLLAATKKDEKNGESSFLYEGYELCCFSAATENGVAPLVGYLPGKVPWTLETRLRELGANVTGSEKGTVLVDRELITGDSPNAENKIAAVATPLLVAFAEKAKNKA